MIGKDYLPPHAGKKRGKFSCFFQERRGSSASSNSPAYTKAGAAGRVMVSLALASQTDTSTKPIHQLLAQQLARLVTSFRAQEGVTSLACRADTKARFYLSHCGFLQVSLPAFHANINNCGYLCCQESNCLGGGKL